VVLSTPRLDGVPDELAALIAACMQRDPTLRPASALEVRRALELFLEHRGALVLATQAEQKLEELERLLAAADVEVERAYNVLGECRFGFRQALRVWPEAELARRGLRRAISAMVRFEAEHGDARAAALLVGELEERDAELEALVDGARRRAEDEAKRIDALRALEKDLDPREGRQVRWLAGIVFGVIWAIVPIYAPVYVGHHPENEGLAAIPVCVLSLLIIVLSRPLWRNTTRLNRQLAAMFAFALAVQPIYLVTLKFAVGTPASATIVELMGYWCIVMGF